MPEIDDAVILNVRTFRRTDSEPSISMDVPELNAFDDEDQPDDTSFDGYTAAEFDEANRVEMHADWYNDETEAWERIIDGEQATWDSTNAEVSFDLARAHTPEVGQYRFEWVLVEDEPDADGNVPTSSTAEHVNTVPIENYYGYRVTSATARELGAREPIDRTVGDLTVEGYIRGPNGPLALAGSQPTASNHATHKQYVDSVGDDASAELSSHESTGLHDQIQHGENPADTITETTSPTSFTFTAGDDRDIHDSTDVTISNASGASASEDITVELYEGADTTGTLLDSETRSITVADATTVTETFIATNQGLGGGDYHVNITQSGTALSIDSVDEHTLGAEFTTAEQNDDGTLVTTDQQGRERVRQDPVENRTEFPGALDAGEVSIADQLGIPVYSDDANAPSEAVYFNDSDPFLKYKDSAGTVHVAGTEDHALGGGTHTSDTLSNLNSKVSDATLDDASSTRPPDNHDLGGSAHGSDTLSNLNSKVSDATLDDTNDARPPEVHDHTGDTLNPSAVDIAGNRLATDGEVIPLFRLGDGGSWTRSTTSSTYENAPSARGAFQWDRFPSSSTLTLSVTGDADVGTDETFYIRLYNRADGETMVEYSTTSSGSFHSSWQTYLPPTTASPLPYIMQIKTDPASNTSSVNDADFYVGIQL